MFTITYGNIYIYMYMYIYIYIWSSLVWRYLFQMGCNPTKNWGGLSTVSSYVLQVAKPDGTSLPNIVEKLTLVGHSLSIEQNTIFLCHFQISLRFSVATAS